MDWNNRRQYAVNRRMGKTKNTLRTGLAVAIVATLVGFAGHIPPFPTDYFKAPLEIPLLLSGSFGELRSNHFHSGLDIKTNEREGYPVNASADGWVSRIKVSPTGYGNALYVDHPNGYSTVYAHLQGFRQDIAEYVKDVQYSKKRFAIDVRPEKGRFPVEQGKLIARSGNSGGSTGPHLHFEIRRTHNSHPLNPQAYGIEINDTTPPRIYRIKLYPGDRDSHITVNERGAAGSQSVSYGESIVLTVRGQGSTWELAGSPEIKVNGSVRFAIQTHDYQEGSRSRLGASRITLLANESPVFSSAVDEFSFAQTRYLNAHIDYEERQENRRWFHRSHRLPGNRLGIYESPGDGTIHVKDGEQISFRYVVEDIKGNTSTLSFRVAGSSDTSGISTAFRDVAMRVPYGESSTFARSGIRVNIPAGALYDDVDLTYSRSDATGATFAAIHSVHNNRTPIHSRVTVSILANELPTDLRDKAFLAGVTDKGSIYSMGGEYSGGYISSRVRSFGKFTIAVDTTAPSINPLNVRRDMRGVSSLRFTVKDDLTGVSSYNAYIDGEWVLMELDGKRNLYVHEFDEETGSPGEHEFRFVVEDGKGNKEEYTTTFTR